MTSSNFETSLRLRLRSLIENIGGEARLETILISFYEKQARDILLGFFFSGFDLKDIARRQKHFMLKAAGLTSEYHGKLPAHAHDKIPPILSGHFDRRQILLNEVLVEHGVRAEDIRTWIGFEKSFKDVIVHS